MASQIPSFMSMGAVYDGMAFGNMKLRIGEVTAIYYKNDSRNISKKFLEYDVLVQHRSNSTGVTKKYTHVMAMDSFGGQADTAKFTYRPDNAATTPGLARKTGPGNGSKVLVLCINGENNNAVIIGGISDSAGPEDEDEGHHLHWRFNGIDVAVNNDGELIVEYQGAQKNDGTPEDSVDSKATGTTITISKNGNVEIADAVKDGDETVAKNIILLDHEHNKIDITGDSQINVTSPRVNLGGSDASSPVPLGDKLTDLLGQLIDAIDKITVLTSVGVSSTPVNQAEFVQIKAKLQSTLSTVVFDK